MKTYIITKENIYATERVAEFKTKEEAAKRYDELLKGYDLRKLERFEWAKNLMANDEANRLIYKFKLERFTLEDGADPDGIRLDTIKESDNYYLG
jgi:plasmid rolling circle replication initiator protein Rep